MLPQNTPWSNNDLFATSLLVLFLDAFGFEGLEWSPATIDMEIKDEFGVDIAPECFDRLMTAIALFTSNAFCVSTTDFVRMCVSLGGHFVPETTLELPTSEEIAWGITEAFLIQPPEVANPLTEEITAFIGHVLDDEGILSPPDVLRVALRDGNRAEQVNYEFSDDPVMFAAITKNENEKTDQINNHIRRRMRALLEQVKSLQLKDGSVDFVDKILAGLPAQGSNGP